MSQRYQVVSIPVSRTCLDLQKPAQLLAQDGQFLLPMLDLIEHAQCAVDDLIDVMGQATIEAVLLMSAAQVVPGTAAPDRPAPQRAEAAKDLRFLEVLGSARGGDVLHPL